MTVDNRNPVVSGVTVSPKPNAVTTEKLSCSGTVSDPDAFSGLTTSYKWTNETLATTLSSTTSTMQLDNSVVSAGDVVRCTVTGTDFHGGSTSAFDETNIINSGPTVADVSITGGTSTSSTMTCAVSASDSDGDALSYTFKWTNDTTTCDHHNRLHDKCVDATPSTSSPGDIIRCIVTASDGTLSDTGEDAATVTNTPPAVTGPSIASSDGKDVFHNSTLTCSGSATDADGDTPTLSYQWRKWTGSSWSSISTGDTLTLTNSIVQPGTRVQCRLTATDANTGSTTKVAEVTVDNSLPVFSTITLSPSDVRSDSLLTCTPTATDPDGGSTMNYGSYVWTNVTQGTTLTAVSGSPESVQLTKATVEPGDTIRCTVTATDKDSGSTTSSNSTTVNNTDPVVSAPSISPNAGLTTSTRLTCTATATDTDAGTPTVHYKWWHLYLDGTGKPQADVVDDTDTDTYTLSPSIFAPDDQVRCEVWALISMVAHPLRRPST